MGEMVRINFIFRGVYCLLEEILLNRFSENSIADGMPMATIEETLVRLFITSLPN
jgi:hypothetical protein